MKVTPMRYIVFITAALLVASLAVQAQTEAGEPPQTAYGRSDLQGVWDLRTITPLQHQTAPGDKAVLTVEEAAQTEAQWAGAHIQEQAVDNGTRPQ